MVGRTLERLLDALVIFGVVAISLLVCWQVVSRYLLSASLVWSEEIATFTMIWAGLLGVCSLMRDGNLIAIDTVERVRFTVLRVAGRFVAIASTLAFLVLLLVLGLRMSVLSETTGVSSAAQIPLRWLYLIFPVTAAIMILRVVTRCWRERRDLLR